MYKFDTHLRNFIAHAAVRIFIRFYFRFKSRTMLFSRLSLLALGASGVYAFPSHLSEAFLQGKSAALNAAAEEVAKRSIDADPECPFAKARSLKERQLPSIIPPFDASIQYVSNKGAHAFVAPSGNDQRGPCPGLNAMAVSHLSSPPAKDEIH